MIKSIHEQDKDQFVTNCNDNFPYGVHLYWLDDTLLGDQFLNTYPLSLSPNIVSVQYVPFLNANELLLYKIPFDLERYKYDDNGYYNFETTPECFVYKVRQFSQKDDNHPGTIAKRVSQNVTCYKPQKSIGGTRNWRNESKLYNYPYRYAYIYDGISEPWEIKYHLCKQNTNELWVRMCLNINGDYSFYIKDYKGDNDGLLEQNVGTSSRDLPVSSSQYAQWLATNKNQIKQSQLDATLRGAMNGMNTGANLGESIPFVGSVIGGGVGAIGGGILGGFMESQRNLATERDMRNLPNSLVSRGGDFLLGLNTNQKKLKLVRYIQREEYLQRIGDYFALYGYKQNRIMTPNINSRYYYNYLKTSYCNIRTNGKIPKHHMEKIREIFNKGTTVWHIDNAEVNVGDYSKDNKEV
ncbi:MAG: hypothetical protein ACRCXT_00710 [Paraclostridium sp.]